MTDVKDAQRTSSEDDDRMLRRLGSAVIVQWGNLSTVSRERIVEEAGSETQRDAGLPGKQTVEAFIGRHQE